MPKKRDKKNELCPICSAKININKDYCSKCDYLQLERQKKKIRWVNLILILLILIESYALLRYADGQKIIPSSIRDAIRTFIP